MFPYQLCNKKVRLVGFEPTTPALKERCYCQLSYGRYEKNSCKYNNSIARNLLAPNTKLCRCH